MKTIGRNQRKKAYEIFNKAKNIISYTLENGFCGKKCDKLDYEGKNWLIGDWEDLPFSKLTQRDNNKFELHIHSNRWIRFEN